MWMNNERASSSVDHHLLRVQAFSIRHTLKNDLSPYADDELGGFLLQNLEMIESKQKA